MGDGPEAVWRCPNCGWLTDEEGGSSCGGCGVDPGTDDDDGWQTYRPEQALTELREAVRREIDPVLEKRRISRQARLNALAGIEDRLAEAVLDSIQPKRCPACGSTDPKICNMPNQPHRHTSICCPDPFHSQSLQPGEERGCAG